MALIGTQLGVPPFAFCRTDLACGNANCLDIYGCPPDRCPDFVIKRFDTKPAFRVVVEDCDGPLDLSDESLVLEISMWANARLKATIGPTITSLTFAGNVGFNQVREGDIIVTDSVRQAEHMLVTGIDEEAGTVTVERGYNWTTATTLKRGSRVRIFRAMSSPARIMTVLHDHVEEDGTITVDQLSQTLLVYEWDANDTCMPGCYWLEFKLLKMLEVGSFPPVSPSEDDTTCQLPTGVEWIRRFPEKTGAFLIQVLDTPTGD